MAALGALLADQEKFEEAESMYRRALAVLERKLGQGHYEVSVALHNLAAVHYARGHEVEAEAFYWWALANKEKLTARTTPTSRSP